MFKISNKIPLKYSPTLTQIIWNGIKFCSNINCDWTNNYNFVKFKRKYFTMVLILNIQNK